MEILKTLNGKSVVKRTMSEDEDQRKIRDNEHLTIGIVREDEDLWEDP